MNWYESVFELIDMRSFSNLWFWIALAVMWSSVSHWVIGVPWDMVVRARRAGFEGEAVEDLYQMVRINVTRVIYIFEQSGLLLTGFLSFVLTVLILLGFVMEREFAQAVFLLLLPMSIVGLITLQSCRRILAEDPTGPALYKRLYAHRVKTQVVGMISIFVTAIWGMLQNMNASVLF